MSKDRRVVRTEQLFLDAYIRLAKTRPAAKITVAALCREAGLNRGTFYLHYRDIPDFLTVMDAQITADILSSLNRNVPLTPGHLTAYILDHADAVFTVLERPGGPGLSPVYQAHHESLMNRIRRVDTLSPEQQELLCSFILESNFSIMRQWWRSGFAADKEEVKALVFHIVNHGYADLLPA